MDEHPHIAMFRRAHEAYEHGDRDGMRAWFADDFVWHEPGNNELTGDYAGADAVFGLFDQIASLTGGRFDTHLVDVLANGRHLVALLQLRAARGDRSIEMRRVNIYTVRDDGRVTERWGYVGDQEAFDSLFA